MRYLGRMIHLSKSRYQASSAPLALFLCAFALCSTGCPSGPDPEPTPTPTPVTCMLPTSRPLEGLQLSLNSSSFDGYYPTALSSIDNRIVLATRHLEPELMGRVAARVWTGSEWQTWDLPGTTSAGGFGYMPFRPINIGGKITVLTGATIEGVGATYAFEENATQDGFGATPTRIGNLEGYASISDVGGLDSLDLVGAIGGGVLTGVTGRRNLFFERQTNGSWAASEFSIVGIDRDGIRLEATGFHTDGTPWVTYSEGISGVARRMLKVSRRLGGHWQEGVELGTARSDDSSRLDAIVLEESNQAVFYWTDYDAAGTSMFVRKYNLETRELGPLMTAFVTMPGASCANCISGGIAYKANGKDGIYTIRDDMGRTLWVGTILNDVFSEPREFAPTFRVQGTARPYYDSCGNELVSVYGRPSSNSTLGMDFTVLPVE